MYVIVEIAGKQFKAEKGRKLYVNRLQGDEGSSVSFDKVLLTDNDGQVKVGSPVVEGASVSAKIVRHLKDDKIIVFKKKTQERVQGEERTPSVPYPGTHRRHHSRLTPKIRRRWHTRKE